MKPPKQLSNWVQFSITHSFPLQVETELNRSDEFSLGRQFEQDITRIVEPGNGLIVALALELALVVACLGWTHLKRHLKLLNWSIAQEIHSTGASNKFRMTNFRCLNTWTAASSHTFALGPNQMCNNNNNLWVLRVLAVCGCECWKSCCSAADSVDCWLSQALTTIAVGVGVWLR